MKRASIIKAISVLAAGAALVAACTVTTSDGPINTGSDAGGSDAASEASSNTDGGGDASKTCDVIGPGKEDYGAACNTCLSNNCCDKATACFGDQDCNDLDDCITLCYDADAAAGDGSDEKACTDACVQAYPNAAPVLNAFIGCASDLCTAECPFN